MKRYPHIMTDSTAFAHGWQVSFWKKKFKPSLIAIWEDAVELHISHNAAWLLVRQYILDIQNNSNHDSDRHCLTSNLAFNLLNLEYKQQAPSGFALKIISKCLAW